MLVAARRSLVDPGMIRWAEPADDDPVGRQSRATGSRTRGGLQRARPPQHQAVYSSPLRNQ